MLKNVYFAVALLAFVGFLAGPALAYLEIVPPVAGFGIYALSSLVSAVVVLIGIVVVFRRGPRLAVAAALLGIAPTIMLGLGLNAGLKYPPINDIATDVNYPPEFKHAQTLPENEGRDMSLPEDFKAQIKESYPDVQSLAVVDNMKNTYKQVNDLAKAQEGWTITREEEGETESFVEGYAVSSLFKFHDDFVIRITKAGDDGCVVDMRSKSRDGQGDLGANSNRIRDFLAQIEAKPAAQ